MSYTVKVKNNSGEAQDWAGETYQADEERYISVNNYRKSLIFLSAITSGDALISDGSTYFANQTDAMSWFMGNYDPRDLAGRMIVRNAATIDGWSAQFHTIGFTTSKLNSHINKDLESDDIGFASIKLYDANDDEITDVADEDECVKTVIDWMPDHDYEIVGGRLFQIAPPLSNMYLWIVALPGILNISFSQGGLNLKLIAAGGNVDFDGRASKYLPYNGGAGTNKLRIILRHEAGVQHELQLLLEIFKP